MTRQGLLTVAVALLLVLNAITLWFLMRRPEHRGIPPEDRPKMMVIERLGFDAEQVRKYEDLIAAHRKAIGEKDTRIREARMALFNDLQAPSEPARDSIANVIGALQVEVERIHHDHFAAVRTLCRPDQIPKFDTLIGELSGFFGQRPPPGHRP